MTDPVSSLKPRPHAFLHNDGAAATKILTTNWTGTSLGPLETWPQSLYTALSILLHTTVPQWLLWGRHYYLFGNDAALRNYPEHTRIGQTGAACLPATWPSVLAWLEQCARGNNTPATGACPFSLLEQQSGTPFTGTATPVYDESGSIGGWLVTCMPQPVMDPAFAELSQRKQLLEAQIEALPSAVLVVDRKGSILSYNSQFALLWGIPAAIIEASDDTAALNFAMTQVADPDGFIRRVQYCYSHPEMDAHEEVLLKDGRVLERHGKAVKDNEGNPLGYIWHFRDVTDLRRSEDQLRAKEERYQNFIQQSTEGIWRFELETPINTSLPLSEQIEHCFRHAYLAECNDAMARMYGYENAQELAGLRISDFFPRNADSEAYFSYFIENGYLVQELESKEMDRHGETRIFSNNLVGIQENGLLVRAWGTQRDITKQKSADEQLRRKEEKYRSLFERMDQGFAILELLFDIDNHPLDYRFIETNPMFTRQTGLFEAVGKTARELVPGIEQHWIDIYGNVALTGEPIRFIEGSEAMGRWFDVHAFRQGDANSRRVAILFTDITERKIAEQTLRESEARFQNLVRNASVGITLLTGEAMKVEIVNQAYGKLIGRTPDELIGRELFSVIPETEMVYRPILERVLHTGEAFYSYDSPYEVHQDGVSIRGFLNLVVQPYHGKEGATTGVLVLCQDVTESVQAKRALEESEIRFRLLANAMPQVVWIAEADGRVSYYNSRIETFSGALKKQDGTWTWQGVLHPEDVQPTEEAWNRAIATGEVYEKAHRIQMADGNYRWHLSRAIPQLNEKEQEVKWFGTATDVHQQMLVQQQLKLAKDQLELTFQNVPAALYLMDAQGKMLYANQQGAAAMGFASPAELLAADNLDQLYQWLSRRFVIHDENGEAISAQQSASAQALRTRQAAKATLNFQDKVTGASVWYLSQAAPLYDESGNIVMVLTAATDITTQRAFTQQLAKEVADRTRELQRSNEDLQQFAHVASHDLKEPVRKVRTFASILSMEYSHLLPEKARTYLAKIDGATERIYKMIDGVLLYSSLDTYGESMEQVNLEEVMRSIAADLEVVIAENNATLFSEPLPIVTGIPTLLYQLLYNLAGNALKFNRPGVHPEIRIRSDKAPEELVREKGMDPGKAYILLQVSDNGIGFESQERERIFQTFARLHSKDRYEGTGLGLSLCKKIVERHGGAIWAAGRPGEGATFSMLLPR